MTSKHGLEPACPPNRWIALALRGTLLCTLSVLWWRLLEVAESAQGGAFPFQKQGHFTIAFLALTIGAPWLIFTSIRIGLWLCYRPTPVAGFLPEITAILPAYNEGVGVRDALLSLLHADYPAEKLRIIAIDDGSQDDTYVHLSAIAADHPDRIRILRQPQNRGKRAALKAGFSVANSEVIVTLDSDCVVEPAALRNLIAPLADPRVASVAGRLVIRNRLDSWLTRIYCPNFKLICDFLRGAQSVNGTVLCCPGALSAHRLSALREVLQEWANEHFMGQRVGPGEDHHLTTLLLKRGYLTRYQSTANVHTIVPSTYRGICRMFLRWSRTDSREAFGVLGWWPKGSQRSLAHMVLPWGSALETLLSVPMGALALVAVVRLSFLAPSLLVAIQAPIVLALLVALSTEFKFETFLICACYWVFPLMGWITPFAALTLRNQSWMGREMGREMGRQLSGDRLCRPEPEADVENRETA